MINNLSLGVVVSRFQIDELHAGHRALLDRVEKSHSHVLVLLGDREGPASGTNPLPFLCRKEMVKRHCPKALVMRIPDHANDLQWSKKLDSIITTIAEGEQIANVILYCGRDGFKKHYHGNYECSEIELGKNYEGYSSTNYRQNILDRPDFGSRDFRKGMIYAMGTLFPRTYLTVDMAIIRPATKFKGWEILLAQREWESKWRFPGGFVESGESFVAAARRETVEEVGIWVEDFEYVGDFAVKDWRLRDNPKDTHKTVLMLGMSSWGREEAGDDVSRIQWHDLEYLTLYPEANIVPEHLEIFTTGLIPFLTAKKKLFTID